MSESSWKARFLEKYRIEGLEASACASAGIGIRAYRNERARDAVFDQECEEAEEFVADELEREARRRAVEGTDKPVIYQGVITETYKEYSDALLGKMLEARRPKHYGRKMEHKVDATDLAAVIQAARERAAGV